MVARTIFIFCLQMILMKNTMGRCIPMAIPEPCAQSAFTSALAMQIPCMPPPGFSVSSDDLAVGGMVTVSGSMPFLGTVSLAGEVPASGQGVVMYNCGNGDIGIVREMPFADMVAPMGSVFY